MTQRETKSKMLAFHNIFGFSGKSIFKFKVDLCHKRSKKDPWRSEIVPWLISIFLLFLKDNWSNKKIGFNSDFNEVTVYYSDKEKEKLSYKKKSEISDEIVDRIINQLN